MESPNYHAKNADVFFFLSVLFIGNGRAWADRSAHAQFRVVATYGRRDRLHSSPGEIRLFAFL